MPGLSSFPLTSSCGRSPLPSTLLPCKLTINLERLDAITQEIFDKRLKFAQNGITLWTGSLPCVPAVLGDFKLELRNAGMDKGLQLGLFFRKHYEHDLWMGLKYSVRPDVSVLCV